MRKNYKLLPAEAKDARAALEILSGSGLSLTDAAGLAVGRAAGTQRTTLDDAADAFIRKCIERKLRPTSVHFYETKLSVFNDYHPNACLDDFKRAELKKWIEAQGPSQSNIDGYFRAIRAMFRWAMQQDPPLCIQDPTVGMKMEKNLKEREVAIFAPQEAQAIMSAAGAYQAAAALMLFAGVRPAEINHDGKPSLLWRHVDFKARSVRIPATIAKTRVARLLEDLPDNLWQWLESLRGADNEPICERYLAGLPRAMVRDAEGLDRWVHDGCRHSFATYHISYYGNTEKTSLIMGHQGRASLLHTAYRGLCREDEAEAFFSIVPD